MMVKQSKLQKRGSKTESPVLSTDSTVVPNWERMDTDSESPNDILNVVRHIRFEQWLHRYH